MEMKTSSEIPPLVFQGRLNEDDVADIRMYHDRLNFPVAVRWAVGVFLTWLAMIIGWVLFEFGFQILIGIFGAIFICGVIALLNPQINRWSVRRRYRASSWQYKESRVTFTNDRVALSTDASWSDFEWRLIGRILDTRRGMLFLNHLRQTIFWLPNRAFQSADQKDQIREWAAENGVRLVRMR